MKPIIFTGSAVAIVTPFFENGDVNYDEFKRLIEWHITEGTDAIVVMGTTGEAATCDDKEHIDVIRFCVDTVAKRIPVIAGVGSNNTAHGIDLSKEAENAGVDALLHVTPYYNKTSQNGLIAHYTAIAGSVHLPILLYNIPGRTGMSIQPETYQKLAEIPNIVGSKEASGDLSLVAKAASLCGEDFTFYSGNDDQVLPILSLGGKGVISTVSNILPKKMHDMCISYLNGDSKTATKIQLEIIPMSDAMFCEVNPIPVKEALNQLGWNAGPVRLPLTNVTEEHREFIHSTLKDYGLIK